MASLNDKLTDVRNAARPNSARVSSTRTPGASTLACDNLAGWPIASKVHFVTYQIDSNSNPVNGTQLDCEGIVSSNTITSFTVIDGSDVGHSVGDVVEMLPTAAWGQDLSDWGMAQHSRTGAHVGINNTGGMTNAGGLVTDTLTASVGTTLPAGDIGTADIADNAVTGSKLATNAIELGYAQITSGTSTNSGTFVAIAGLTTTVTVPSGGRDVKITVELPSLALATTGGGWAIAIYKDGNPIQQIVRTQDAANFVIPITAIAKDPAPSAGSHTYAIFWGVTSAGQVLSLTANAGTSTSVGTPGPAFVLVELI